MSECIWCGGTGETVRMPDLDGPVFLEACHACLNRHVFQRTPTKENIDRAMEAAVKAIEQVTKVGK